MDIRQRTEMLRKLGNYFEQRDEVRLAYLFGSTAAGRMHPLSDTDVAVLVDESKYKELDEISSYGYRANMAADLMSILHKNRVDVVILNQAAPLLAFEVVKEGMIILCRDEELRLEFEIRVKKCYLDTQRLREIQWLYLSERIEEGRFGRVGVG